ncbi:MAG: aspartate-semialdehyde dehydrogenase [Armatimonadota bacterium]|nr:MAG: aspartate-semialdehyde dehydrogenase [Armatimonadota bacterium]
MSPGYHVAIAGATGAVGTEFLRVLEKHRFPIASLRLLASERSEGKKMTFAGETFTVQRLTEVSFDGVQIAFFSAGASRSRQFAPAAVRAGAVVIDNSSAFRMDPQVPLVVPEINMEDAREHKGIIANPNCSTIIMLMAVAPLHRRWRVKRVVVSTYQAASGAGAQAMQELLDQTTAVLEGKEVTPRVLPHQIAFNLFSHNSAINEWGYNEEEWKMIHESRKILHEPELAITATCVRVPVLRAHSESINIEFAQRRPSVQEAREALSAFPGVKLVDDRERNHFPMPIEASEREEVLVGRIREDISNPMALELFVSGDQLLKGAALNAVQIAEGMIARGWL